METEEPVGTSQVGGLVGAWKLPADVAEIAVPGPLQKQLGRSF